MSPKFSSKFNGTESFLVGIAPNYWAHVPMAISDVEALRLVEGTYCAVFLEKEVSVPKANTCDFIPIQKCYLVGFIVNIQVKSNDSVVYVLDDGTGFIDCIDWKNQGVDDEHSLLLRDSNQASNKFEVGDLVSISGRIQCKAIVDPEETVEYDGKEVILRRTILDVQITNIDHARDTSPTYLDMEARHWMSYDSSVIAPISRSDGKGQQQSDIINANDFLELLGPKAQCQVRDQQNLPDFEDKLAAWRVFGPSCRCSVPYKDSLLYCHCQAKHEPLDPGFKFRDEVLAVLLDVELCDGQMRLEFKYNDLVCNDRLAQLATSMVTGNSANPFLSANRLFVSTFQALRSDGIIYLVDAKSDTYLLVSRSRVLEPHVKGEMVRLGTCASPHKIPDSEKKPFLSKVHNERLMFIRRALAASDQST